MNHPIVENQAIIQRCHLKEFGLLDRRDAGTFHTNCSMTGGASGSLAYVRNSDNRLVPIGIITSASDQSMDGISYSNGNSSTYSRLDAGFLENVTRKKTTKEDERYGMKFGSVILKVAEDDVEWLNSITGEVRCTSNISGQRDRISSGTIIGNNNQIVTSANVFSDRINNNANLECFFTTRSNPAVKRRISQDDSVIRSGPDGTSIDGMTYAFAKLEQSVPKSKPLQAHNSIHLRYFDRPIIISAQSAAMHRQRVSENNEMVIQKCNYAYFSGTGNRAGHALYTDCIMTDGQSGSIVFLRSSDNRLEGVGIIVGSVQDRSDPFSHCDDKFCSPLILAFDDAFVRQVNGKVRAGGAKKK